MKGTAPIITCDDWGGCSEFAIDWYELGVTNWREFMPGWQYDPYRQDGETFCPDHTPAGDAA